jgi:deazaflavin-dependent oxidoreductase (nitroreductase family)
MAGALPGDRRFGHRRALVTKRYFTPTGRLLRFITASHRTMYRLSGGRLGTKARGLPTLLLTTTGRKSGQKHTVPLPFLPDGERMVVVASFAGGPSNPAWYLNLTADPDVLVQYRGDARPARAETATGEALDALWTRIAVEAAWYVDYQQRTDRQIPVVVITPSPATRG